MSLWFLLYFCFCFTCLFSSYRIYNLSSVTMIQSLLLHLVLLLPHTVIRLRLRSPYRSKLVWHLHGRRNQQRGSQWH